MPTKFYPDFPAYQYGNIHAFGIDENIRVAAHEALATYRTSFTNRDKTEEAVYPWRIIRSHTGLPAFLRGHFMGITPRQETPRLTDILAQWDPPLDLLVTALFGRKLLALDTRFTPFSLTAIDLSNDQSQITVHLPYQQYSNGYPIFGAQVAIHLATHTQRAAITSAYLPLINFDPPNNQLNEQEASQAARDWFLDEFVPAGYRAAQLVNQTTLDRQSPRRRKKPSVQSTRLTAPRRRKRKQDSLDWALSDIVPYAGSRSFIFPFRGVYRLAYQVEFVNATKSAAWRVIIDAVTGAVLGAPFALANAAQYFATAQAAEANTPAAPTFTNIVLADNPAKAIMTVTDVGGNAPTWTADPINDPPFAAINVAVHANNFHTYFEKLLDVPTRTKLLNYQHPAQGQIQPGLFAQVGSTDTSFGSALFVSAYQVNPKTITFRAVDPAGIVPGSAPPIHNPAHDPELIYHELTHALMWLLKSDQPNLFDHALDALPFANALTEGYATYFARSFAEQPAELESLWALAAYRKADWSERWAFARAVHMQGEDYLPIPNHYPYDRASLDDLRTYNIGMIWARSLWDLRAIFGAQIIDKFALDAYNYLQGWAANFELAAEGLLDVAAKFSFTPGGPLGIPNFEALTERLFNQRGTVTNQNVQTLVRGDAIILAGADAGMFQSLDNGKTWNFWGDVQPEVGFPTILTNVVESHYDAPHTTFYAATEQNLYKRDKNGAQPWQRITTWPGDRAPILCLHLSTDAPQQLYVGTSDNLWVYNTQNDTWQSVNDLAQLYNPISQYKPRLCGPVEAIDVSDSGDGVKVHAACFDKLASRTINNLNGTWRQSDVLNFTVTTVVSDGQHHIYVGTLGGGIIQGTIPLPAGSFQFLPIANPAALIRPGDTNTGAVLSLAWDGATLLAGTTAGLFYGVLDPNGQWQWASCSGNLPGECSITNILVLDNQELLLNTAIHGVYRGQYKQPNPQWNPVQILPNVAQTPAIGSDGVLHSLVGNARSVHFMQQAQPQQDWQISINEPQLKLHVWQFAYKITEVLSNVNASGVLVYTLNQGDVIVSVENSTPNLLTYVLTITPEP